TRADVGLRRHGDAVRPLSGAAVDGGGGVTRRPGPAGVVAGGRDTVRGAVADARAAAGAAGELCAAPAAGPAGEAGRERGGDRAGGGDPEPGGADDWVCAAVLDV